MFGQFIQIAIYPHLSVSTATFLIQFAPHLNHQNSPWTFFLTAIQLPEENFVNKKLPGGSPAQTHHSAFPCPWEKVQFLKRVYKTLVSGLLAYNLASPHSSHLQPYLTSSGPRIQCSSSGETLFLPPSSGHLLTVQTPWHAQENLPSLPRLGYLSYLFSVLSLPFYNTFMTFPLSDLIAIWRWEESYFSCWYSKMADTEQI